MKADISDWEEMDREQLYNPGEEIVETDRLIMRRLRPDDYLASFAL